MLNLIILLATTILAVGIIYLFFVIFLKGLFGLTKNNYENTPDTNNGKQTQTKNSLMMTLTKILIIVITLIILTVAFKIIFFIIFYKP